MKKLKRYQVEQFEFERLHKMFDEIYSARIVNNRTDSAILAVYCLKEDIKFDEILPLYEKCRDIANVNVGDSAILATGLADLIKKSQEKD